MVREAKVKAIESIVNGIIGLDVVANNKECLGVPRRPYSPHGGPRADLAAGASGILLKGPAAISEDFMKVRRYQFRRAGGRTGGGGAGGEIRRVANAHKRRNLRRAQTLRLRKRNLSSPWRSSVFDNGSDGSLSANSVGEFQTVTEVKISYISGLPCLPSFNQLDTDQ